ncbi:MAG: DegT/DnrJ/EryC1/StrS family aminotransferase [Desulfobacterales bacterium]|nr:DegT/DnrJ/EryC1/StrS family aminotransferase [Desulfobacterales bacterium]
MKTIPFLDLAVRDTAERQALLDAVERVLVHGKFINGPELTTFEEQMANFCRRRYAVGVNSGTDALYIGLKALGIGPGEEVLTTAFSWIATANAICMTGARPVFVDIGPDLNLDPAGIEPLITDRTRAIMPVHYAGQVCRMDAIGRVADRHNLLVVEDAAQAVGATCHGQPAGSFGDMACASLNPMKLLSACGEAGVILTDDDDIRAKAVALRYNGMIDKTVCTQPGLNGRMDTLQAAILIERLEHLEDKIQRRIDNAAYYQANLNDAVGKPVARAGCRDIYFNYLIQVDRRDDLADHLQAQGIEVQTRDWDFLPRQPAYQSERGRWTQAAKVADRLLCLPVHEGLTGDDLASICLEVNRFLEITP